MYIQQFLVAPRRGKEAEFLALRLDYCSMARMPSSTLIPLFGGVQVPL